MLFTETAQTHSAHFLNCSSKVENVWKCCLAASFWKHWRHSSKRRSAAWATVTWCRPPLIIPKITSSSDLITASNDRPAVFSLTSTWQTRNRRVLLLRRVTQCSKLHCGKWKPKQNQKKTLQKQWIFCWLGRHGYWGRNPKEQKIRCKLLLAWLSRHRCSLATPSFHQRSSVLLFVATIMLESDGFLNPGVFLLLSSGGTLAAPREAPYR